MQLIYHGGTVRLLSLLLVLSACKVFDPSLVEFDVGVEDAGAVDTPAAPLDVTNSVDVRPDTSVEDGCEGEAMLFPQRPSVPDSGGDEIVLGLHELLLRQDGDRWRSIGRNLDGLCSRPPVAIVECQPRNEETLPQVDGTGGIDNTFGGAFFDLVNAVAPDLDFTARQSSSQGVGSIVVRVRGYNGEANDSRVEAAVLQSVYAFAGSADESAPAAHDVDDFLPYEPGTDTRMALPTWDGNDWLFPRDENFYNSNPETPVIVSNDAYVADGVLVITLEDNVPFNFASSIRGISVKLTDARLVIQLGEGDTPGQAQLSGRWKIQEMLQSARTLDICEGTPQYDILARQIDMLADVLSRPGDDSAIPCDAMSVGVQWEVARARIGSLSVGAQPPILCD